MAVSSPLQSFRPMPLVHQVCLSFLSILTVSCSHRDITNTYRFFVSSSGPTGALRYLASFTSHRKDLDFSDMCLRDKLVYRFHSLLIFTPTIFSLQWQHGTYRKTRRFSDHCTKQKICAILLFF